MSTNAGTEEHRISGALLSVPRRTPQFPSLPFPDVPASPCTNAALAAHAEGSNRVEPLGDRLRLIANRQAVTLSIGR
jgi:hypothetical protein